MLTSLAQANIVRTEIVYIIIDQIIMIRDIAGLIQKKFNQVANKTIIRKAKFIYHTLIYHLKKLFS